MKISVGTTNKGKIEAVNRAITVYELLKNADVQGVNVQSGVNDQPIGMEMILRGAMNRAKAAFEFSECDLAFGLESGIFPAPFTKSDYFDTCACAIYDGKEFHLGLSSCVEFPSFMIKKVINEGKNISEAAVDMGIFEDVSLRESVGTVGKLTHGKLTRIDYTYQSIITAMVHLQNKEYYS